ncbi:hypothetical protein GOBAR_DD17128 [Gossypium barbadense]|nr:hypothetical protein GOBAR_DD17128 [Gossypium barbadense]
MHNIIGDYLLHQFQELHKKQLQKENQQSHERRETSRPAKKSSAERKTKGEPTWWQRRLRNDISYINRMLETMKPFISTFMVSQRAEVIQWPTRSNDLSEVEDDRKEEVNSSGNEGCTKGEDEASKGSEASLQV